MLFWIAGATVCTASIATIILACFKFHALKEQLDYFRMINEHAEPTYFEYDILNSRMISSMALADLYGAFGNDYRFATMEDFPACAVRDGNVHPDDSQRYLDFYNQIRTGAITEGQMMLRVKNDYTETYVWSNIFLRTMRVRRGQPIKAIGVIRELDYTDKLTGLDNKFKFEIDAANQLGQMADLYAFVFLDVKDFKMYNEVHGYEQGDQLLRWMADQIHACVQQGELCAHSFSDRFLLLLRYESEQQLRTRLTQLIKHMEEFQKQKAPFCIFAGICIAKDTHIPVASILDRARFAQREIKNVGCVRVAFFEESARDPFLRRQELEGGMDHALENGRFQAWLQPCYSLVDGALSGAEVLVRWQRGAELEQPREFLPLFEQNGFIRRLDLYMAELACQTLCSWRSEGRKLVPLWLNLSRPEVYAPDFAEELANMADRYKIDHALLKMDIPESSAFLCREEWIPLLERLQEYGFGVYLDDYGTRYTTPALLCDLPLEGIKLDRGLFARPESAKTEAVVGSLLTMAVKLGMRVVAERVETRAEALLLRHLGCGYAQGFYFSKPERADLLSEQAFQLS